MGQVWLYGYMGRGRDCIGWDGMATVRAVCIHTSHRPSLHSPLGRSSLNSLRCAPQKLNSLQSPRPLIVEQKTGGGRGGGAYGGGEGGGVTGGGGTSGGELGGAKDLSPQS